MFEEDLELNEVEWTKVAEIEKAEFLAAGEAYKAIYYALVQAWTRRTFLSSGFLAVCDLYFCVRDYTQPSVSYNRKDYKD